jgi:hypothetical protein
MRSSRSNSLRRLSFVGCGLFAAVAACDRPEYSYSDDVPIAGSPSSFGGTFGGVTAGSSTGGTTPMETCGLDRVGGTPALAKQAISHSLPARPDVYLQLTDAEAAELKKTRTLLPATPPPAGGSALVNLLNQVVITASASQRSLLMQLVARFKVTRATWPNPWALRLIDHPGSEHMNTVRITFKKDALIVRIVEGLPAVSDVNNATVPLEVAAAAPERVAAIYYVLDARTPGSATSCENGKRELALGNEAMVEEFSLGTPEILARVDADILALTALFDAARPCSNFDRGDGMTFHASTVCTAWSYFDALSEYSAYQWSLSNPMELYKPTPQNLSNLVAALELDRLAPEPFVAAPNPIPYVDPTAPVGGAGGEGGAGGAAGAGTDGGAAFGGAADGGSSL